jgi:hypothetical protein
MLSQPRGVAVQNFERQIVENIFENVESI